VEGIGCRVAVPTSDRKTRLSFQFRTLRLVTCFVATYLQVVFSMDENVSVQRADADQSLRQQNDRLQLLLRLTNSITSNLELTEVLRAIAETFAT
jgi:hypothetical protein